MASGQSCGMRALLAGISGVNKNIVIANLLTRLRAHGEVSPAADPRELLVVGIEDALGRPGQ